MADAVRANLIAGVRLQSGKVTEDEFDATTREVIASLQAFDNAEAAAAALPDVAHIREALQADPYLADTPVGALHASTVLDHVYAILAEIERGRG